MGRGEERVRCMERVTWKLTFRSDQIRSVARSCPTLCDPIDGSPPGSPIPGILQARTLECIPSSLPGFWARLLYSRYLHRIWDVKNWCRHCIAPRAAMNRPVALADVRCFRGTPLQVASAGAAASSDHF